ncbi:class F sortase [Nocardioides sp. BYT-33-1]|uniref:class F sortase n=1 Tax=Nocardioides sp. BYT-33-1 TaxID=3416952 RepID=UPI003F52FD46
MADPFRPHRVTVPGLKREVTVLPRGRERSGVPKPPPLTARGKKRLAWDRTIRAGESHGVVRLTAHTYPSSAGPALGNRLLRKLKVGAVLEVTGRDGQRLCYRVSERRRVRAAASVAAYYSSGGRPRLAILVCSGVRRGPGDWSHRTIWFAEPVSAPDPSATARP